MPDNETTEAEKGSLAPELLHFGLNLSHIPSWGPNPGDNNIVAMFRTSISDVKGRKIAQTIVLLEDLIAMVGQGLFVVTSAFRIINRMKGFKLEMVDESKESLIERCDEMIENLNEIKRILFEDEIIARFEPAQSDQSSE